MQHTTAVQLARCQALCDSVLARSPGAIYKNESLGIKTTARGGARQPSAPTDLR